MAISQVITFGGSPDQLVWKYPDENITTTSQLIVDETHEALLVVNGAAADLFGPGTRTLSLPNIPILNQIAQIPTGGVNPFPCKVFYVNKVHHLDLLWGTQGAPIALEDPDYQIFLHVMLHGSVGISVGNSRKFLLKLAGFRKEFRQADIIQNFKGLISAHVKDCISKIMIQDRVGFFRMNANLMEISAAVKTRLDQIFEEYGVILRYFNIESIEVPEKDYDAVKKAKERRAGRIIEGYTWKEERQMDIAKTFAGNEGSMGAMGGVMGGMMGGAMMGGTLSEMTRSALGREIPEGGFRPDQILPNPGETGRFCTQCGTPLAQGAKFCSECGAPQAKQCPQCGAAVPPSAKFCSGCGQKL